MSNLFGSETPVNLDNNDGVPYTLGTKFHPTVNGSISGIKWYAPASVQPGSPGVLTFGLYDSSSTLLTSIALSSVGKEGAWGDYLFTAPVSVTAGQDYMAVVYIPNRYVSTSGYSWPKTTTDLVSANPGGYYNETSGGLHMPTQNFGGANYFVDVIFTPAGGSSPTFKVWNGTAEVAATMKVWNGTSEVDASFASIV